MKVVEMENTGIFYQCDKCGHVIMDTEREIRIKDLVAKLCDNIKDFANDIAGDAHSNFLAPSENIEDGRIKATASDEEWAALFVEQMANCWSENELLKKGD
jgi:hypothetical protein